MYCWQGALVEVLWARSDEHYALKTFYFTPIYEPSYRRQGGHGAAWAGHGHGVGQRLGLGPGQAAGPGPRHGSRPRGRRGAGRGGSAGPGRGERAGGAVGPAVLLLALPGPLRVPVEG